MAFNLKLPAFVSGKKDPADHTISATTVMDAAQPAAIAGSAPLLSFLGQYSVTKQLQILGGGLLLVMLIIAGIVYHDNRESTYGTAYIAASGEMRMLSQRLAKASSLALQGNPVAFKQLKDSHDNFASKLERLTKGGDISDTTVPPSPNSVQPQLQALTQEW